jgi:two-component system sensor histidine kinase ChvG
VWRALSWLYAQVVRIRTRLLVINLVAVLVPVVGIHWARTFEHEGLKALEADMRHVAETLRTLLERSVPPTGASASQPSSRPSSLASSRPSSLASSRPSSLASSQPTSETTSRAPSRRRPTPAFAAMAPALELIAKRTRMRVRLLDRGGGVIADSHVKGPPEGPEDVPRLWGSYRPRRIHPRHKPSTDPGRIDARREIRAARKGRLGTATRYHRRIKRVFLFLAMPVMVDRRVEGVVYITRSTIPVLEAMYRLRTTLLQVLGFALGLTALLSLFLATTISRPLTRLSRTATRLASGARDETLRLERRDEIGELSRSFAALLAKLDGRARYISEFAANISHEFKTPLASMRGAAELLADTPDMDEAARQRFLGNILADVQRLDRLVSRLLQLSRIEATLEHREPFDLREVVCEVVDSFAEPNLAFELPDSPLRVRAHRAHLASSLRALIENALRHSDPDGDVKVVGTALDGRRVALQVADEGSGISEANVGRIFDRFFTTEGESGGTGLGLAIVQTVVRAHGGEVKVESTLGDGAVFTLDLPILD